MNIVKKQKFLDSLMAIVLFRAEDKPSAAVKFYTNLNKKLETLPHNPKKCRKSLYRKDENYRDLIFDGYTIIYKISKEAIIILDIFKWQKK